MTQRRVENTRVHFWTFPPVSVKVSLMGLGEEPQVRGLIAAVSHKNSRISGTADSVTKKILGVR